MWLLLAHSFCLILNKTLGGLQKRKLRFRANLPKVVQYIWDMAVQGREPRSC